MERRLFDRGATAFVRSADSGSGVRLPRRERHLSKRERTLAPALDATHHNSPQIDRSVWLGKETVLVVNNLSGTAQAVELDLRRYKGNILIEMFGNNIFPRVGDLPYLLTLGPFQFYWFRLRRV